jgi:hypothetical protein
MTATNHAVTGAVIAVVVSKPALALPLAFLSHFVLDLMPHFGLPGTNLFTRGSPKDFQKVLKIDITLSVIFGLLLLIVLKDPLHRWLPLLCSFVATSPDLVWGFHFYRAVKNQKKTTRGWFSRLHAKLNWNESPEGMGFEIGWLILMLFILLTII